MKKNTRGRKFVHVPPVIGDNGKKIKNGRSIAMFSGSIPKGRFMLPIVKHKSIHRAGQNIKVYKEPIFTINRKEIVKTKKGWTIKDWTLGDNIHIPREGRIAPKTHKLRQRLLKIKELN